MAQDHDARLFDLVEELGGDRVRILFRDLLERALQELIDTELTQAIGRPPTSARRPAPTVATAAEAEFSPRRPET